jgi:hypothetical protein
MSALTVEVLAGYEALDDCRKQALLDDIEGFLDKQRSERRAQQRAAKAAVS